MTFQNRPRDWQTLYPDCPIGVRITDLWQNQEFSVQNDGFRASHAKKVGYKSVVLFKNKEERLFDSQADAARWLDVGVSTIVRRIKTGKDVNGYRVRLA